MDRLSRVSRRSVIEWMYLQWQLPGSKLNFCIGLHLLSANNGESKLVSLARDGCTNVTL